MNDANNASARNAGRRRKGVRRQNKLRQAVDAPAYVNRQIPFYEFLGEEGLVRLEEQADWDVEVVIEVRDQRDLAL